MKISTNFNYNSINFNKDNEVILMTSVTAPNLKNKKERTPLNLSLVLDISMSMSGSKLKVLKDSVIKLVEQLKESDTVSVVAFGSHVHDIFEPQPMSESNKIKLKSQVEGLRCEGCTNLSGGLFRGLDFIKDRELSEGAIHRVLVLTDGCANEGITDLPDLNESISKNLLKTNITISSFGFGEDHDENMLSCLADVGKGNFYYIPDIESMSKVFNKELGGLLTCVAQNISLSLNIDPSKGEFIEVLNDLNCESPENKKVKISLDDLYEGETKHVLVKMNLNKTSKAVTQRASSVVDVILNFNDLNSNGDKKTLKSKAKIKFVKEKDVQKEQTLEVLEQIALIELSKAHLKAKNFADSMDYVRAQDSYRATMGLSDELARRGSSISSYMDSSVKSCTNNLNPSSYSKHFSKSLMSTSRKLKTNRGVNLDNPDEGFVNKPKSDPTLILDPNQNPLLGSQAGTGSSDTYLVDTFPALDSLKDYNPYKYHKGIDLEPDPKFKGKVANKKDGLNKKIRRY